MRSRERLLDVSATIRLLDSARHNIVQRDYSKAIIFLEFARNECVQIQELAPENSTQKRQVGGITVRITRLIEGMTLEEAEGRADDTAVQRGLEARNIMDSMSAILARLRYRYSENGTDK
jgi:hypothetical protein